MDGPAITMPAPFRLTALPVAAEAVTTDSGRDRIRIAVNSSLSFNQPPAPSHVDGARAFDRGLGHGAGGRMGSMPVSREYAVATAVRDERCSVQDVATGVNAGDSFLQDLLGWCAALVKSESGGGDCRGLSAEMVQRGLG